MPKPKPNYEYTQRRIPVDLWPEVAKMIEEYKQKMKGCPIKNTCTADSIKLDTPAQIGFHRLDSSPVDGDTPISDIDQLKVKEVK